MIYVEGHLVMILLSRQTFESKHIVYMLNIQNFEENISIYLVFILLYGDLFAISSLVSKNTIISNNIKIIEVIMNYYSIKTIKNKRSNQS